MSPNVKIAAPKPPIGGLEMQVALEAEVAAMPAHKAVGIASPNPTHHRENPTRVSYTPAWLPRG
ncbi:hypothetical protein ACVW1C_004249 [Bradyrhizobium sp. USDA 4011]